MIFKSKSAFFSNLISLIALVIVVLVLLQVFHLQNKINAMDQHESAQNMTLENLSQALPSQPAMEALVAESMLANLQALFLKNAPKTELIQTSLPLFALLNRNTSPIIKATSLQLRAELQALPDLNLNATLASLDALKDSLATLSFVPVAQYSVSVLEQSAVQGFWARLWQQLRPLLVVRTNNQIGPQLVTDAGRLDAVRNVNFLIDQVKWQVITEQDPSAAINQLKAIVISDTAADAAQSIWLNTLSQIGSSSSYYNGIQIAALLSTIADLEGALVLNN